MLSRIVYIAYFSFIQTLLTECSVKPDHAETVHMDHFNAVLAAQVEANRAAITSSLAEKYGSKARAENTIAEDLLRKSKEKSTFAGFYKTRAEKLEEQAKKEEKLVLEDKKNAQILEENSKILKSKSMEIDSRAKIKENLAFEYRSKAKEQHKEAQLAEIASKEAKTKAEGYEYMTKNAEKLVSDLEKTLDHIVSLINYYRRKTKEYLHKARYEKLISSNQLERAGVFKKNAHEYERAATETELSAKSGLHASVGLHIQAEEERSRIKVEDVKAKYDGFIAQLFLSQANDNKHFAEQQLKDAKFYESRANIAKARALVYQKTSQEVQKTSLVPGVKLGL